MARDYTGQLIVHNDPKAVDSEAFRILRTNLQFASLNEDLKVISFTSTGPGEGKSVVCANLAVSYAQAGARVILIDCDLRKPAMHSFFGLRNNVGLTSVLTGQKDIESALQDTQCENLRLLASGPIPPNPAEMLHSSVMQTLAEIKGHADKILIDAPPAAGGRCHDFTTMWLYPRCWGQTSAQGDGLRAKKQLTSTNARSWGGFEQSHPAGKRVLLLQLLQCQ